MKFTSKVFILIAILISNKAFSSQYDIITSQEQFNHSVFGVQNNPAPTDLLGVDFSGGLRNQGSCGAIDIRSSLDTTLKRYINQEMIKNMGMQILGSAPMLALCYMSPSACSQLKHLEKQSAQLVNTRIDQCGIIEKHIDKRASASRQMHSDCVQGKLSRNGGDLEDAINSCTKSTKDKLPDWDGDGEENSRVALINDSKKWANIKSKKAVEAIEFAKKIVGDEVYESSGEYKIDFEETPQSIYSHRANLKGEIFNKLLNLVYQIKASRAQSSIYRITDNELNDINSLLFNRKLTRGVIEDLSYIPDNKVELKLASFSEKLSNESILNKIDYAILHFPVLSANPNLGNEQRRSLIEKTTLLVQMKKSLTPQDSGSFYGQNSYENTFNEVEQNKALSIRKALSKGFNKENSIRVENTLNDCADRVFCKNQARTRRGL